MWRSTSRRSCACGSLSCSAVGPGRPEDLSGRLQDLRRGGCPLSSGVMRIFCDVPFRRHSHLDPSDARRRLQPARVFERHPGARVPPPEAPTHPAVPSTPWRASSSVHRLTTWRPGGMVVDPRLSDRHQARSGAERQWRARRAPSRRRGRPACRAALRRRRESSHPAASVRWPTAGTGRNPQAPHRGSSPGLKLRHVFGTATRRHPLTVEHRRTQREQRPTLSTQVGRCFR
jgi:hypothetical protein